VEPTTEDWTKPVALAAFFVLLLGGIMLAVWRSKAAKAKEDEERSAAIKAGVDQGILNEHGQPLCVVCGEVATHPTPRTGRMWIDKIPGLRMLNDLTAMPWRYSVEDDYDAGPRLCKPHRRSAVQHLNRVHAAMRAEHAEFNARQEQKVHMLDQGGLERLVLQEAREIKQQLGLGTAMRTLLGSTPDGDTPNATHVLTASSAHPPAEEES